MFQDALLESAPRKRKRNHWAMATAFAVELAVAAVLILLPLVSTGIIPLKATVIVPTPQYTPVTRPQPTPPSGHSGGVTVPAARVIPVSTSDRIPNPFGKKPLDDPTDEPPPLNPCIGNCENGGPNGVDLGLKGAPLPIPPPVKPVVISHTTEAMLLNKVVPEYPLIAKLSGLQGDVKLHAFVGFAQQIIPAQQFPMLPKNSAQSPIRGLRG